ncbi:MAG TPA: glycosyltransferase, partial [Candidatus Paceibacterota bacterium]
LADHPVVLCYAVGNEIPASVVRWYGKAKIERFIKRLGTAVKSEDPSALVTYVNFPTTEYLDLSSLDVVSFNVYLETKDQLASYLTRLQNIAGDRPLLLTELGLDSRRNGETRQAQTLDWQIETAFEHGCAGAFVFAWTDEWFRGGYDIEDWDFGLTTRDRQPKQALRSVSCRFANVPFSADRHWPRISVVVCTYNGSRTIGETLTALKNIDYPNYEIIVIDDGSTDRTNDIAQKSGVKLIRTKNNGLSAARNLGMNVAGGEIVAYIDDDAYPDPHWLTYLASAFIRTKHVGIGGPNIAPSDDGVIADCVANSPGGPIHVLLSDELAEHIPGCNMAYRRDHLIAIGGFDPRFRIAGDDVDICWRLQEKGWTLGFAPTALVWHHRRNSIKNYFKQQRNYAAAEALLADKWPDKYNRAGHVMWRGRLYGRGIVPRFLRARIYHGVWGSAPFQSIYEPGLGQWSSLMLMPEWYFLLLFAAFLVALSASWTPLRWLGPLVAAGMLLTLFRAARGGMQASFHPKPTSRLRHCALQALVGLFYLIQPAARLMGRVEHGLAPWTWRKRVGVVPFPVVHSVWSEQWETIESRLREITAILKKSGAVVIPGGDFDIWDLSIDGGLFGITRVVAMVEEHGNGRQLIRFRARPKAPSAAVGVTLVLGILAGLAGLDGALVACTFLALVAAALGFLMYADCAIAMSYWQQALDQYCGRNSRLSYVTGQEEKTSR